jgi:DNA-binding MarR family transcriptional regulator
MAKRPQVPSKTAKTLSSKTRRKTLVDDTRAALEECAGWHSRLAARRITKFLDDRVQKSGLSLTQFGLLAQVAAAADDTLGALADRMGLDQSTLSRNLRGLETAGLVEIASTDDDLRRRAVWLTEEGARRLEAAIPIWRDAHAALAQRLDPQLARRLGDASQALVET